MDTSLFLTNKYPLQELASVFSSCPKKILSAGEILIEQGRPVQCVGIIQSGSAKVSVVDCFGEELICGYLKPQDLVFDVAVLSGTVATASVISLERTSCLVQSRHVFIETIEADLPLKTFFYRNTALGIRRGYEIFCGRSLSEFIDEPSCAFLPPFVRKAIDFIDANYNKPITLEMMARETAMSKFHFSRLFKKHVGLSFKQILNRRRITAAKVLILQSGYNVTEAGFAVGFNDASYFARVFRDVEGLSPKFFQVHGRKSVC